MLPYRTPLRKLRFLMIADTATQDYARRAGELVSSRISLRVTAWRRIRSTGTRPRRGAVPAWLILDRLDGLLHHVGIRLRPQGSETAPMTHRELHGPGSLRYLASADDGRALISAVLEEATRRLGRHVSHLRDLGKEAVLRRARGADLCVWLEDAQPVPPGRPATAC